MYLKVIAKQIFSYKSKLIEFTFDNKTIKKKVFLFTCANAGQYGNNFYIAPNAKLDDGFLDLVVVPKCNSLKFILAFFQILLKSDKSSSEIQRYRIKNLIVKSDEPIKLQTDGDSKLSSDYYNIYIQEKQLLIL